MNKILVEVSVGELLDKISILEIKKEKIKESGRLKFVNDEYNVLKEQLKQKVKSDETLNELFDSNTKYESGSGWPSFFKSLPDVFEEKTDMHIGYPRTEYHCKKCGGHHGHIFDDGPKPTGKRYCNNGVCLVFKPKS